MASPLPSIAVIGAGLIGRKHIETVRQGARLAAIIDPSEAARALAAEIGVPHWADLQDYLGASRPDGAIIASPNALHLPQGLACLGAGLPTLIEKPLADSHGAALQLAAATAAQGAPCLVGHHRRHSAVAQHVSRVIAAGRLGKIVSVTGQFWLRKPDDYFDVAWRTQPGAGPTYINLIHDIDLLRWFCGEIVAVQAMESNGARGHGVEDSSAILLGFESGALGTVSVSDAIPAPWSWELTAGENPAYPKTDAHCYLIGGTQGSLAVPNPMLWRHPGAQSWWAPIAGEALEVAPNDPIAAQLQHFCDVIAGRAAPLVTAEEGARNIAAIDAIKEAARTGAQVRVQT